MILCACSPRCRGDLISEAVRALVADMSTNHETMRMIRDNQEYSESVRLRTAQTLDASLLKWRELLDVEQRLTKIEEFLLAMRENKKWRS